MQSSHTYSMVVKAVHSKASAIAVIPSTPILFLLRLRWNEMLSVIYCTRIIQTSMRVTTSTKYLTATYTRTSRDVFTVSISEMLQASTSDIPFELKLFVGVME